MKCIDVLERRGGREEWRENVADERESGKGNPVSNEEKRDEMQTDSECESDVSSIAESSCTPQIFNREHFVKRLDSLTQENRVLKVELETYKLRLKASQQEIKQLKQFVCSSRLFLISSSLCSQCQCSHAGQGRARRRVHFQHSAEEDSRIEERKRNLGEQLRARRRIPHQRSLEETATIERRKTSLRTIAGTGTSIANQQTDEKNQPTGSRDTEQTEQSRTTPFFVFVTLNSFLGTIETGKDRIGKHLGEGTGIARQSPLETNGETGDGQAFAAVETRSTSDDSF